MSPYPTMLVIFSAIYLFVTGINPDNKNADDCHFWIVDIQGRLGKLGCNDPTPFGVVTRSRTDTTLCAVICGEDSALPTDVARVAEEGGLEIPYRPLLLFCKNRPQEESKDLTLNTLLKPWKKDGLFKVFRCPKDTNNGTVWESVSQEL